MAIDVRILPALRSEAPLHLCLEDDGYYWFLHPWLESLREQTGKYLDLYGDAVFTRDDFPRLRRLLDEARAVAVASAAEWDVCVGMQLHPTKGPIHRPVQRDRVLAMIEAFRTLVAAAERSGRRQAAGRLLGFACTVLNVTLLIVDVRSHAYSEFVERVIAERYGSPVAVWTCSGVLFCIGLASAMLAWSVETRGSGRNPALPVTCATT